MAWYNNLGDLTGDLGSILHGKNPSNNAPPLPIAAGGLPNAGGGLAKPQTPGFALPLASGPSLGTDTAPTTDASGGGGFDWLGALKQVASVGGDVLGFLNDHSNQILQAANIANSAYNQSKANDYATQAVKQAQDAYTAKAPLRTAGISGMQFAASHGNPFSGSFANALPVAIPAASPPAVPPPSGKPLLAPFLNGQPQPTPGPVAPTRPLSPMGPASMGMGPAIAPTTADTLRVASPSGSSVPSSAPSVGQASTPPSPMGGNTPQPLNVATRPGAGKSSGNLARANNLELAKLY